MALLDAADRLSFSLQMGAITAATTTRYLFRANRPLIVKNIWLISPGNASGHDGSHNQAFQVTRTTAPSTTANLLSTAFSTNVNTNVITASVPIDIGANQNLTLATGDSLLITNTNTGTTGLFAFFTIQVDCVPA